MFVIAKRSNALCRVGYVGRKCRRARPSWATGRGVANMGGKHTVAETEHAATGGIICLSESDLVGVNLS